MSIPMLFCMLTATAHNHHRDVVVLVIHAKPGKELLCNPDGILRENDTLDASSQGHGIKVSG